MNKAKGLDARLRDLGIELWPEDDGLRFRSPRGVMTGELRREIALHKAALIALLGEKSRHEPIVIRENRLSHRPGLQSTVQALFRMHGAESSALARRDIAPFLFIGSEKKAMFTFNHRDGVLLAFSYVGPADRLEDMILQLANYCEQQGLELNALLEKRLERAGELAFTATPFCVRQFLPNIQSFGLNGNKMRRLRYQVTRFEKAGQAKTHEYRNGSDPETDRELVQIIDAWCAQKNMVNPYVHRVRQEILDGNLPDDHRLFLTYLDEILHNLIVITQMNAASGFLMDLEFYPASMPPGGLEFGIVAIIQQLRREGHQLFSMGATLGARILDSPNADPQIESELVSMRERGIFDGEGNLQFKNKFRTENRQFYLCRIEDRSAKPVTEVLMLLADPAHMVTVNPRTEVVPFPSELRTNLLKKCGYNPANLDPSQIPFEMASDSWGQIDLPFIRERMRTLNAQGKAPTAAEELLAEIFPFKHFVLAKSGRGAESLFFDAWPKPGLVPQNLLFPTWLFRQIEDEFTPIEIPVPEVFDPDGFGAYKGNLDCPKLRELLDRSPERIAFVVVELCNNAAGGQPVSPANLAQIRDILTPYGIPFGLDATRVLENALAVKRREPEWAHESVWNISRELCRHADFATASLCKDFGLNLGGFAACNDKNLYKKIQSVSSKNEHALTENEKQIIAHALSDRPEIENAISERMACVRSLWSRLGEAGLPVLNPCGGHCVLIDACQIPPFAALAQPLPSFLAWLFEQTGIRAGIHNAGMSRGTPLNRMIRLAIPIGTKTDTIERAIPPIIRAYREMNGIRELTPVTRPPGPFGAVHTVYA